MASHLALPFFKDVLINLGVLYFIFVMLVMVGASNAVNLTDGLDGLAIVPVMIAAGCFALISYLVGNLKFADYLQVHHVPGSGELAIFCAALVGASMGFLWFNAPPAQVFMGDTGSLALGGSLGVVSVITKHELVLAIIGGLFVVEAVSVIVQVASFKMTGRRIFKMAPLHHHFEKLGWSEPTIVIRFWIIACILGLIGLSTLKLRCRYAGAAPITRIRKSACSGWPKRELPRFRRWSRAARTSLRGTTRKTAAKHSRSISPKAKCSLLEPKSWPWKELEALVLSPGVPLTHPAPHYTVTLAQEAGVRVIGDIELLCEAQPLAKKIAITGTNGKSTTTSLIGHILKAAGARAEVGGNLGTSALTLAPQGNDGCYVLELSSYQLDLVQTARFNIAMLLNITPDHLDRHGGMEGYVAAKSHIFERQTKHDAALVNIDDDYSRSVYSALRQTSPARIVGISVLNDLKQGVFVDKEGVLHDRIDPEQPAVVNLHDLRKRSPAAITGRMRPLPMRPASSTGSRSERLKKASRAFPACAIACSRSPRFTACASSTTARRLTRTPRRMRWRRSHISTGSRAENPRRAASHRWSRSFPISPMPS